MFAPLETESTKGQSRSVGEILKLTETGNRQSLIEHKVRGGQLCFTETTPKEIGKWVAESSFQSSDLCGYSLSLTVLSLAL